MSLSNHNSSSIVVNGTSFRWAVAARSQSETGLVTVVVQPPDNGSKLAVQVPCRDPYLNIAQPAPEYDVRSITPRLVRQLIDDARSIGWNPFEHGPQFDVSFLSATLQDEGGADGATCHVCWQCLVCNQWYSDDVEFGATPPIMTTCGRTKHHGHGLVAKFILFWSPGPIGYNQGAK